MKKLFAAISAASILLSLCACTGQQPDEPTTEQTTTGAQEITVGKEIPEDFHWLTYEEYKALTPEQQQAYYESFPSPEEYMVWFNAVAKEYNHQLGDNSTQVEGNEGQITQPTEPAEKPQQDPVTPTQKPEKEDPATPTQKPEKENPETPTTTTPEKKDPILLTYEEYLKLSPALQQAYYESFPSMDAYMQWFKAATKEYNDKKDDNSTQVDGNEGQITQPTEQETNPPETTLPDNTAIGGLTGSGGADSGRPQNP